MAAKNDEPSAPSCLGCLWSWLTFSTISTAAFLGYCGFAFNNLYGMLSPGGLRGFVLTDPDGNALDALRPLWRVGQLLDVEVYVSSKREAPHGSLWHRDDNSLRVWHATGIPFDYGAASTLQHALNITKATAPPKLWRSLQHHTAFMHMHISHAGVSPQPRGVTHDRFRSVHLASTLFKPAVVKRELRRPRWRLLYDYLGDCGCGSEEMGEARMEAEEAEHALTTSERENFAVPHWIPKATMRFVPDRTTYPIDQIPANVANHLFVEPRSRRYRGIVYHDDMAVTNEVLVAWNDSIAHYPLALGVAPAGVATWQFHMHIQNTIAMLMGTMGGDERDADEMRNLVTGTNPVMLALAMIISVLHLLFDALAFKSDISFWNGLETLRGLSTRAVFAQLVCEIVITLFLQHEGSSLLVLFPATAGIFVQAWKVVKVWRVDRAEAAQVAATTSTSTSKAAAAAAAAATKPGVAAGALKDTSGRKGEAKKAKAGKGRAPAARSSRREASSKTASKRNEGGKEGKQGKGSSGVVAKHSIGPAKRLPTRTCCSLSNLIDTESDVDTLSDRDMTKHYDRLAGKYLGTFLYPIAAAYAAYSLLCTGHEGLYEWALSSLVAGVYTFGFITMTPQLFINYSASPPFVRPSLPPAQPP